MKRNLLIISLSVILLASCSEYQKLLKSTDPELKYSKAVQYFEKGDFMRASSLFDEVTSYFRGTERSEEILNYLAKSYMGQKDYFTATEYYKTYTKTYPKGKYIDEAKYMIGYCYYLDSPDARLDQTSTMSAFSALQEFVDLYPQSPKVSEAYKLIEELKDKLAYKQFLSSKLYYNLGNYLWNNYESAVITAQNALKDYPDTKYREELLLIVLESKYQQALQSIQEKKIERYRNTIDEYYNFINEYPQSRFKRQAERIFNESKKIVKD